MSRSPKRRGRSRSRSPPANSASNKDRARSRSPRRRKTPPRSDRRSRSRERYDRYESSSSSKDKDRHDNRRSSDGKKDSRGANSSSSSSAAKGGGGASSKGGGSLPQEAAAKISELAALGRTEKQIHMNYAIQKFGLSMEQVMAELSRLKSKGGASGTMNAEAKARIKELIATSLPEKQIAVDDVLVKLGLGCELILAEVRRQKNEGVIVHVAEMDYGQGGKSMEQTIKTIEKKVAALEAEAEGWGQNKRTMVREAESYEVQLTDLLLVVDKEISDAKDDLQRHNAKQLAEKIKKMGGRLQALKDSNS